MLNSVTTETVNVQCITLLHLFLNIMQTLIGRAVRLQRSGSRPWTEVRYARSLVTKLTVALIIYSGEISLLKY